MTPKEKAIQLYEKFYYKIPTLLDEKILDCLAQECALITVDEMIKQQKYQAEHMIWSCVEYFEEVKQEIEKL